MTKRELAYFKAALAIAELSDHPQYKVGAVVVNKHKIISSGCNTDTKCHPIQKKLDSDLFGSQCVGKLHSEVSALLPLIKNRVDLSNATIYVARKNKQGELAMARPCSRCEKLIRSCGIRRIYYSCEGGYSQEKW